MDNLKFYTVDYEYIKYLQNTETNIRGFSRVPNLDYGKERKQKFVCGVVFKINNINYFAPITSYKNSKPDNFLIYNNKGDKVLSSLRFNYMFPIPFEKTSIYSFDSINDKKYRLLVLQEYRYCKKHQSEIKNYAKRTYKRVLLGKNIGLVKNSCDFKLLEQAYIDYCAINNISLSDDTNTDLRYMQVTSEELKKLKEKGFEFINGKELVFSQEKGYILKLSAEKEKQVQNALGNPNINLSVK